MVGAKPRNFCERVFKRLDIFTLLRDYVQAYSESKYR